jgi:signal transduction histidine kinase
MIRIVCVAILFCLTGGGVSAYARPLVVDTGSQFLHQNMAPYISVYSGSDPPADSRAASALPDTDFAPVGDASPLRLQKTLWFRFTVRNESGHPRALILDLDQALLNHIEWLAKSETTTKTVITGQGYPYASRDIDYDFFAFHLDIPAGETMTVNFSTYTPFATLFVPKLTDSEKFISALTISARFSGAVMGMLHAVCFFLFLYVLRLRTYGIAHALFVFCFSCLLSVLYISGIVQRYLPDNDAIPYRDMAYVLIHGMQGFAFAAVLRGLYQTKQLYPFLDKVLLTLMSAVLLLLPLWLLITIEQMLVITLCINTLLMLAALVISVYAIVERHRETYIVGVGLFLFILLAVISTLGSMGVMPVSFMTRYGYELGLTILVDFLLLSVIARMLMAEREIQRSENEVIKLNADIRARSEFVDRVTHDIKSPLSAVIGAADLMRDRDDPQDKEKFLGIIQRSSYAVLALIDDILRHSQMQAGQLTLNKDVFSISQLIKDIEQSINAGKQNNKLKFVVSVSNDVPPFVDGDKLRLSRLLMNILTNAFKFTDQGSVTLAVDVVNKNTQQVTVRFIVEDTGMGMSEGFLQKAFEPYTREQSGPGYRSGFGLGLSICKQIVDKMDGTVIAVSQLGQGSCFTVVLPFNVVPDFTSPDFTSPD